MSLRSLAATLGAGALVWMLTVLPAGAAHAADPLELSLDGSSWSASLPGRLFASPEMVVPGDVITSALWVRNGSTDSARVDLTVADDLGVTPGTLAGDLSLTIDGSPATGGSRWHGPDLAPGGTTRIPLVVTFAVTSEATSMLSVATVLDSVILVQTGIGAADPPTVGPSPSPSASVTSTAPGATPTRAPSRGTAGLAHTGADVARVLGVSFGAIGVGLLLLVARRRSRRAED